VFPRVFRFGLLLFFTFLLFGYFVQAFFVLAIRFAYFSFIAFVVFAFGLKALRIQAFAFFVFCDFSPAFSTFNGGFASIPWFRRGTVGTSHSGEPEQNQHQDQRRSDGTSSHGLDDPVHASRIPVRARIGGFWTLDESGAYRSVCGALVG
jgi:hypothetical protein